MQTNIQQNVPIVCPEDIWTKWHPVKQSVPPVQKDIHNQSIPCKNVSNAIQVNINQKMKVRNVSHVQLDCIQTMVAVMILVKCVQ